METDGRRPMTKDRIKQYVAMGLEIQELEYKLDHLGEGDSMIDNSVIMDYRDGHPRPQSVVGVDWEKMEKMEQRYKRRLDKIKKEMAEIEGFVENIPDSRTRQVFEMHFLEGKKQREIAGKMHLDQSMVSKIIEKNLKK